jgi:hypothetical protein
MRVKKYKPKFFPFSPGIAWKIDRGKYIIPDIDLDTWHKVVDNRDVIITAFGSLIESFASLCAAEAIKSINSSQKIYWLGNSKYSFFIHAQGLCKPSIINLQPNLLKHYPVPLFLDNNKNVYFNILNNYLTKTSYWGLYPEAVMSPVIEQIANNIMIPWRDYIPQLRNLGTDFIDDLKTTGRIRQSTKIIAIILNNATQDILGWTVQNIREFSQLASRKGWRVIIFTHNTRVFYGSNILAIEYNLKNILQIIKKSWVVISNDVEWLLIALMISGAAIISKPLEGPYNLFQNAEFLGVNNDIFTDMHMSTLDAFRICEGL